MRWRLESYEEPGSGHYEPQKCPNCGTEWSNFGQSLQMSGAPAFKWCHNCGAMEWDGNGFMQTHQPALTAREPDDMWISEQNTALKSPE